MKLHLDADDLRQFISEVVREVLAAGESDRIAEGEKLAYSEPEAARLLSLHPWQLRDERLRGRITASSIVGRRVRYTRKDLESYLASRRTSKQQ